MEQTDEGASEPELETKDAAMLNLIKSEPEWDTKKMLAVPDF